jgi:hypothetical protein
MTSGFWIWLSVPFFLFAIFLPWELLQLKRRRSGNQTALTKSQYATRIADGRLKAPKWWGKFMRFYILLFPIFIALVGVWLIFHWQAPCINFGWFCDLSIDWLDI